MIKSSNYLSLAEKRRILDECDRLAREGVSRTLGGIAAWAKDELKLDFMPSTATISRIRAKKDAIRAADGSDDQKRKSSLKIEPLDKVLAQWVCDMYCRRLIVTGDMIKTKGERLTELANKQLPDANKLQLKFSNGWLDRFKKRLVFKKFTSHGKGKDADGVVVAQDILQIKRNLSNYALNDIWNAGEFGLFYDMAPNLKTARRDLPERKHHHARMTFLACANADGTEKFPLLAIGKYRKPRSFTGKTGPEHGFDYYSNKRAWMNSFLFFAWLQRFDRYIGSTPGRSAVLLLRDCSAHGTVDILPQLEHTKVIFLKPDTTSKVLPMGAGIIAAMKLRYRRLQMSRALGLLNGAIRTSDDVCKVDVLTALRWMRGIWAELEERTIFSSWSRTHLVEELIGDRPTKRTAADAEMKTEREELLELINGVIGKGTQNTVNKFLNPDGEDDCIANVTDEELASEIVHAVHPVETGSDYDDEEPQEVLPPRKAQLRHLNMALKILEHYDNCPPNVRLAVARAERKIHAEHKSSLSEGKIKDERAGD